MIPGSFRFPGLFYYVRTSRKTLFIVVILLFAAVVYNLYPVEALDTAKKITRIEILKNERQMKVFSGNALLKTYIISLGNSPAGPKEFEGDGRTPEGIYSISSKNEYSKYHLSLGISYPNEKQKAYAAGKGKSPGGDIMIHGLKYGFIGKFHRWMDWTQGCIAVTNGEIEELFKSVSIGTPVEIKP